MAMTTTQEKTRQRTCIGCGEQSGKSQLFRIVRRAEGGAAFDASGRLSGRGAYVCSPSCFVAAQKNGKLDRALRTKVSKDDYSQIAADLSAALDASNTKEEV